MSIDEALNVNAGLIARLRQLADVLEHEDVPDLEGYAGLFSDGQVIINESAFRKLFAVQSVSGRKESRFITASAEACGITFEALIYDDEAVICDDEDGPSRGVTIQL